MSDQPSESLFYSPQQLAQLSATEREQMDLVLMRSFSDTMEPAIAGDAILVVRPVAEWKGEGVYVFRMEDSLNVYRMHKVSGHMILVYAPNEHYHNFKITPTTDWEPLAEVLGSFRL